MIIMILPKRKLPRLAQFDYSSPGIYFITICTHEKQCLFGSVTPGDATKDAQMHLSPLGKLAKSTLLEIESHYDNIKIDNWIIMPNHVHLLMQITERIIPFPTSIRFDIPNVVGRYKAAVTRNARKTQIYTSKLWQSSFHDHIIRSEKDYLSIWQYISGNAGKWSQDCFYVK